MGHLDCSEVPHAFGWHRTIHIFQGSHQRDGRPPPRSGREGAIYPSKEGRFALARVLPTGSVAHTPTRRTVTSPLQTVSNPWLYLGFVIEMWRDVHGRLWMDTGQKDRQGEMIIELLDGSQAGPIVDIANRYKGLTPVRKR